MYLQRILSIAVLVPTLLLSACLRSDRNRSGVQLPKNVYIVAWYDLVGDQTYKVTSAWVTPEFFSSQGCQPYLGRVFLPEDFEYPDRRLVVLSHRIWLKLHGADQALIGKKVNINNWSFTVIGVMPPSFDIPPGTELWLLFPPTVDLIALF